MKLNGQTTMHICKEEERKLTKKIKNDETNFDHAGAWHGGMK